MCVISKPCSHEELEKYVLTAAIIAAAISCSEEIMCQEGTRKGCPNIPRQRKSVEEIFSSLGPTYSKSAYRMRTDSFYKLHDLLCGCNPNPNKRKRGATQNGPIASKSKLSMALRFFAGGDNYDIGGHHGVHTNAVHDAVWEIVDRVNGCESLQIKFPDHEGQKLNTQEFMKKLGVNFNLESMSCSLSTAKINQLLSKGTSCQLTITHPNCESFL